MVYILGGYNHVFCRAELLVYVFVCTHYTALNCAVDSNSLFIPIFKWSLSILRRIHILYNICISIAYNIYVRLCTRFHCEFYLIKMIRYWWNFLVLILLHWQSCRRFCCCSCLISFSFSFSPHFQIVYAQLFSLPFFHLLLFIAGAALYLQSMRNRNEPNTSNEK